ncbi:spore germination protein GerKC [Anoxybacillus suryakundensis]|uniref:Germination protein, Ger(X)C family n=1 Tax=Anoxybacillus suryakundensis TaxID=1325335 RepID=A0A0K6GPM5_9BACL|nr:Ger(x)C family spore germination protein [Anoxybacillus suryakundensis]CUA80669.1 germination protein, Ger(x)C family [Anoxybacillus suryakundensis]
MKIKRYPFLIFMLFICTLLFGCWSKKELRDLALIIAVGIDKKDGKYISTFQVVNPGNVAGATQRGGGSTGLPVALYTSTGDTLVEASRKASKQISRIPYYAHTNLVVVGEELAKEGIQQIFDVVERNPQFRPTANIVIARKQTAKQLLSVLTPVDKIPANQMIKTLELTEMMWGENVGTRLREVIESFSLAGKEVIMSSFHVDGNRKHSDDQENVRTMEPTARLRASELAIFKRGKLVGWIGKEDARGVLWILDKIKQTAVTVDWKGEKEALSYKVVRAKTKVTAQLRNGKPIIFVTVATEGDIGETFVAIDFTDPKQIVALEKVMQQEIKSEIEKAVHVAQKKKSDIFGFGEVVHRTYPKEWKKMKKMWNDKYFPKLDVQVKVESFIRRTGLRTRSYIQ